MNAECIWIFLDDSNLWIEAKKAKGDDFKRKEFKEDPRLRIEFGELATFISNERQIKEATLYGSEPPPSDSVWEKGREQGWKVNLSQKCRWSGKEKMVDTQIVADVTELVCDPKNREHGSTVVIVSGDKDMYPCIEKAMARQWNVEVWAMENSLSEGLKSLNKQNQFVKVQIFLKEDFEKITYIKEEFTYHQERKDDMLSRGVVLQQCQRQGEERIDFMGSIKNILDSFNWPWQYTRLKSEAAVNILILFCRGQGESDDTDTPLNRYKPELEKQCVPKLCKDVLTYFQYDKSDNQYTAPIETHNRYGSLPGVQHADDVTTPSAATDKISEIASTFAQDSNPAGTSGRISPSEATQRDVPPDITHQQSQDAAIPGKSSEEPFKLVRSKKQKRYQRSSDFCQFQYQCVKGKKCTHNHREDQKLFFEKRNRCVEDKPAYYVRTYKTCICMSGKSCQNRDACAYAHSEDEQVCCKCHLLGHATDKCPKNATDQKK
ncbi:uncharacterized protein LOC125381661 [Haliotis rufescens]|uniref:uncharacterized protein LOC125381661 n=1 Tax=Haliotis rufescens TaxID=6454 RepID=UPI00201F812B|nr:uncharacterized protein LOC125381661 [Haliotis rufescens]XP_048254911.1 uncharacterized protein LOC125381661 [Haliotis rufescens]